MTTVGNAAQPADELTPEICFFSQRSSSDSAVSRIFVLADDLIFGTPME
jgi:hypothetical protein